MFKFSFPSALLRSLLPLPPGPGREGALPHCGSFFCAAQLEGRAPAVGPRPGGGRVQRRARGPGGDIQEKGVDRKTVPKALKNNEDSVMSIALRSC